MKDPKRELIRHTLATLAYRCAKTIRGASPEFAGFRAGDEVRTPVEILAHIGDLLDWSLSHVRGAQRWNEAEPLSWEAESNRFHTALGRLDAYFASDEPLHCTVEEIFQGPIADALTHVGQIAIMRRIAGESIRPENYLVAAIETGLLGEDQPEPVREF